MEQRALDRKLQHLYWRAGFGPTYRQENAPGSIKQAVRQMLRDAQHQQPLLQPAYRPLEEGQNSMLDANARLKQQRERRQSIEQLNYTWLNQMVTAREQLREKMTLFWHGHFACRLREPGLMQLQNNTLRQHALGKFPDLLLAISKDPGMLQFLNNQQNRKRSPNENFAREVLELFTLGRGYYTEQDIKEAARAFTGWGYNAKGEFVFRERQHDAGPKTFMGHTGNFTGEDILKLVVQNPQTATFITQKLYTYFVSDLPDTPRIAKLSAWFYKSGYDISGLLERMFTAKWFYEPALAGAKIKSPVELLVGLQRQFAVAYADSRSPYVLQRALGQELLQPPNVGGWPGGRNWIDSSTLAYRLRIGPALLQDAALAVYLKPDDDSEPSKPTNGRKDGLRIARAKASIVGLEKRLEKVSDDALVSSISQLLLQVPLKPETKQLIEQGIPATASRTEKIHQIAQYMLSLPEYQLC
ncbi:DUF1800 domain-containing protein [Pontibacter sp. JH31]|uniref:DUF1800 domain-containing protein n=1 Tax=Pontibacter aquaedesilientis TaxID=2766980 RepID=A0ABR7XC53_9BACT|nr:DUF1800 domain-containing protein [Pontibacter aquaedesilientis]MBD1395879.1 DUF1800 domain-containing protein [Pontibacter aquaedesilientis]